MSATLIDGKAIAKTIHKKTAEKAKELKKQGISPKLAVVLIGDDRPSQLYVKKKMQAAERVGIEFELHNFPNDIYEDRILQKLRDIQEDSTLTGLIVQLPIPEHFYPHVINAVRSELDVDCLTETNLGKLLMQTNTIVPPTPGAALAILESLKMDIQGKNITIVGTGVLVGKPLAVMLMNLGASVTTCNVHTTDVKEKCLQADILISAVGKKDLIRGDMVKSGAVVIDAGVDFENNQMFGDVNVEEVSEKASYLTPTPGGVGPLTVAQLLWNTVVCAEDKL